MHALHPAVEDALRDQGLHVVRISGDNRYETARAVADQVIALGGPVEAAILVRAGDFPDAMSAANLGTWARHPILVTDTDELHPTTMTALEDLVPGDGLVTIAGGVEAVSASVEAEVAATGRTTQRHDGASRYDTSVAFIDAAEAQAGAGVDPTWIASGDRFQTPIVAAVAARATGGTMLLVAPATLDDSPASRTHLAANADAITQAMLVGDDLSDEVIAEIEAVLG